MFKHFLSYSRPNPFPINPNFYKTHMEDNTVLYSVAKIAEIIDEEINWYESSLGQKSWKLRKDKTDLESFTKGLLHIKELFLKAQHKELSK